MIISALCSAASSACTDSPVDTTTDSQTLSAYRPFGFARVTATAGLTTSFNSSGGAVTATPTALGKYRVTFAGLATTSTGDAAAGNVQLTTEGTDNTRCRLRDWSSSGTTVLIDIECLAPDDPANSGFAVMYVRDPWPTPNTFATNSAYTRVSTSGFVRLNEDYNSSGVHNEINHVPRTGRYSIRVPGANTANASIMITPLTGIFAGGLVCGLTNWAGDTATIECRSPTGFLADNPFSFLYSVVGPSFDQQGAHAQWSSGAMIPGTSAALGKYACSSATVRGSASGSLVSITVAGDLGSWDGGPFLRASFPAPQGGAGYCKIESLTATGVAPSSSSTTQVRCYTPAGAAITSPSFRFTHVTSDPQGPC